MKKETKGEVRGEEKGSGEHIDIRALYEATEKESMQRTAAGTTGKSAQVREQIIKLFKDTGKNELLQAAAFKVLKQQFSNLDRVAFTSTIKRSFATRKEEDTGRIWVISPEKELPKKVVKKTKGEEVPEL